MVTLQNFWKMFFFSSKKLFSLLRLFKFLYYIFLSLFFLVSHCCGAWSKINLKVYDIINCLNKNFIRQFVWYLEKEKRYDIQTLSINIVLNKENFIWKVMQKIWTKSCHRPLFYFIKQPKTTIACKKLF